MSAFVVKEKTINRIVNYLADARNLDFTRRLLEEKGYDLKVVEGKRKLFNHLYSMNLQAVDQRYKEKNMRDHYSFKLLDGCMSIAAYKAFNCFMYQCCEGNIPETDLYKLMDKVQSQVARHILSCSKEYDTADWG